MKRLVFDCIILPVLFLIALLSRLKRKKIDIGLGPEPLINNVYHKKALMSFGYTCETFVVSTYFITQNFDIDFSKKLPGFLQRFSWYIIFAFAVFRYRCLYIYFNGGPLYGTGTLLRSLEPYLLRISGTKVVVMPYGGDVMDCSSNKNLLFKYGLIAHYPDYSKSIVKIRSQVARWTRFSDYIFSGCDWVDYTYYWDKLMLAHFSIDTEEWKPKTNISTGKTFKVLHAPNHRIIKGTESLIKAIDKMKLEGKDIELILLEKKPNSEVKELIQSVDLVVDQLIVGWYAMFALEGMSSGKPVICYIRDDLKKLYEYSNILQDPLPLISAAPDTIYEKLCDLFHNRDKLEVVGRNSREFVIKYHSIETIGKFFDEANRKISILPTSRTF